MLLAAFRVAENHPTTSGICQHPGCNLTGVGSLVCVTAILSADSDLRPLANRDRLGQMHVGGANCHLYRGGKRAGLQRAEQSRNTVPGPMHLPISDNQRLTHLALRAKKRRQW